MVLNTLYKAIVYRIVVIISQLICLYLYTGELSLSVGFSLLFGLIATIEYIIFEKYWKC